MTTQEVEKQIVKELATFDDWMDKYEYIIAIGKSIPLIDYKLKTNERLVKGCQSKAWLNIEKVNGKISFTADSDAAITKGIIALLIRVLNNRTPEEIQKAELSFLASSGLSIHLTPSRNNGILSIIKQMKGVTK